MSPSHYVHRFQFVVGLLLLGAASSFGRSTASDPKTLQHEIRNIVLSAESTEVQHVIANEIQNAFQIRVNVPDVNEPAFQRTRSFANCRIDSQLATPQSASALYPTVARMNGTDLNLYREELIKRAIGQHVLITLLPRNAENSSTGIKSPLKPPVDVHGTILGFKEEPSAYSIQLISDNQELFDIKSRDIAHFRFDNEINELGKLMDQLQRRSSLDAQTMMLCKVLPDAAATVNYLQPTVSGHEWQTTIFASLDDSHKTANIESWATIWNDTFYDWKGVYVTLKNKDDSTYTLGPIDLPFGRKGSFKFHVQNPFDAQRVWTVEPPADISSVRAKVTSAFAITNTTKTFIPKAQWTLRDSKNAVLYSGAVDGISAQKQAEIPFSSDQVAKVGFSSMEVPLQAVAVQGDKLLCKSGTISTYSFPEINGQANIDVRLNQGVLATTTVRLDGSGTVTLPKVVIDPKQTSTIDTASGFDVKLRSIPPTSKNIMIDLWRDESQRLMFVDNLNKKLSNSDDILRFKGNIEKIRRELLRMETERKDLSSRPTIGTMSGFRYAIQSDHA
ncbi:MAG: hypothetical protein ABL921_24575, partial [Pirellula sp.]